MAFEGRRGSGWELDIVWIAGSLNTASLGVAGLGVADFGGSGISCGFTPA